MHNWHPPDNWQQITTIDAHTAGEPLRIITSGLPDIPGDTILAKRAYARQHHDDLRRALMWEPRGHADMYGAIFTEPTTPDGDVGVLFIHNEGFSTMCGHGIIAMVKVGVETGYFPANGQETVIRIDTPAGRVTATAHLENGHCQRVSFVNVPSFVLARGLTFEVDGLGTVTCDIAYGGAFYAYTDADALGLTLNADHQQDCINTGMAIKRAVMAQYDLQHPAGDDDLNFLYGTIFVSHQQAGPGAHSRNVCVFADGEVDRSPTGTGVSGRVALHYARSEIKDETITVESIIGTRFTGRVLATTPLAEGVIAVLPEIGGTAHITGQHRFLIDPDDPLAGGFILR